MSQGIPRLSAINQQANIAGNQARTGTGVNSDFYRPDNSTFNQAMASMIESNDKNAQIRSNAFSQIPDAVQKRAALDAQLEMEAQRQCAARDAEARKQKQAEIEQAAKLQAAKYANQVKGLYSSGEFFKLSKEKQDAIKNSESAMAFSLYGDNKDKDALAKAEEEGTKSYLNNIYTSSGISEKVNSLVKAGIDFDTAFHSSISGKALYTEAGSSEYKSKDMFDNPEEQQALLSGLAPILSNVNHYSNLYNLAKGGVKDYLNMSESNAKLSQEEFKTRTQGKEFELNAMGRIADIANKILTNNAKSFENATLPLLERDRQVNQVLKEESSKLDIALDRKELNKPDENTNSFFSKGKISGEGSLIFNQSLPKLNNMGKEVYLRNTGKIPSIDLNNPSSALNPIYKGKPVNEAVEQQNKVIYNVYSEELAKTSNPLEAYNNVLKKMGLKATDIPSGQPNQSQLERGGNIAPTLLANLRANIVSNYDYIKQQQNIYSHAQTENGFNSLVLGEIPKPAITMPQPTVDVKPIPSVPATKSNNALVDVVGMGLNGIKNKLFNQK